MLKHIKDIRSPIAVAQQKHAARKASSIMTNGSTGTSGATLGHAGKTPSTSSRALHRPPQLQVDLSASAGAPAPGIATAMSPAPGWPDGMMSPSVERSTSEDPMGSVAHHLSTSTTMSGTTVTNSNNGHETLKPSEVTPNTAREMPPVSSDRVSYAVAIYPYMAEQEDEFDVVV
jgi:bZIP factor